MGFHRFALKREEIRKGCVKHKILAGNHKSIQWNLRKSGLNGEVVLFVRLLYTEMQFGYC